MSAPLVEVVVDGEPVAKERPRTFIAPGGKARTITPAKTQAAETTIATKAKLAYPHDEPTTNPVAIALRFYCGPKQRAKDVDNLSKTVLDALNKIIWKDDKQVLELWCRVERNAADPRTEIEIWELTP